MPRVIHSGTSIEITSLGSWSGASIVRRRHTLAPHAPCKMARYLMRQKFVVWDTETTGLDDDSKIVSIGIVDQDGNVLLDTLINPGESIPGDAIAIHGITDDAVASAPTFADVYPVIRSALQGKVWAIYNKAYDIPRLTYEYKRYFLPAIEPAQHRFTAEWQHFRNISHDETFCLMESFAVHYGDWSDYWESYKWQSLSTAARYYNIRVKNAHNALADAMTTLQLIRAMALDED